MQSDEIAGIIRKLAIKNAIDYGKADEKAVLSKVISKIPTDDRNVPEIIKMVGQDVERINSQSVEQLKKDYEEYRMEFEEYDKEKAQRTSKPRMELEGAKDYEFVTRFAPEPSGYMHIGHASAAFLAREFARIYHGKVGLYFDDTNAAKEKQEFVDAFKTDLDWLGIKFDKEYFASDSIEKLYEYAQQLISTGGAYVCTCDAQKVRELRLKGIDCEHKSQSAEHNLALWKDMLAGKYDENNAVLRFLGDIRDQNTAMRDPTLFRIKRQTHYRQGDKYFVWPTYDFNTPIMDSIHGVTDAIRTKEYELRDELYYLVLDRLGLRKPRVHSHSRIVIVGNIVQKREINGLIGEGKVEGYDDPRLITISAMRRRGISPLAIKDFVLKFGMSKAQGTAKMETLLLENRRIIDKDAIRLFCVEDAVEVHVSGGAAQATLRLHPTNTLGFKNYSLDGEFYLGKSDLDGAKELRLKDLYDIRIESVDGDVVLARKVDGIKPAKIVQWVPKNGSIKCKLDYIENLVVDDKFNENSMMEVDAIAESRTGNIDAGTVVQFERIGYFKLDNKSTMTFLSL